MIERDDANGFTAVYMTSDWEPTDKDGATLVKLVFDDGRVMFLTDPNSSEPVESEPDRDVVTGEDHGSHEHGSEGWDKHRAKHAPKKLKVYGKSLDHWARHIAGQDLKRIETVINTGLLAQDDNTAIAHRVIGSRRHNGINGVTEITRQHILHLGRGYLRKRKNRMGGASTDVR